MKDQEKLGDVMYLIENITIDGEEITYFGKCLTRQNPKKRTTKC
jgi:hypothetical protein